MNNPSNSLRRKQAAEYLKGRYGVGSVGTLAKLASIGGGPIYIKLGGAVVYDPADLDARLKSVVGAFETGLFIGLCDVLVVGTTDGVELIETKAARFPGCE